MEEESANLFNKWRAQNNNVWHMKSEDMKYSIMAKTYSYCRPVK